MTILATRPPASMSPRPLRRGGLAPYLLECLRCPRPRCVTASSPGGFVEDHPGGTLTCACCGSTYSVCDGIVDLSDGFHRADPVFRQEFDDWEDNAEHYVHEPNAPLYQLLHACKMATFGIAGRAAPVILDLGAGTGYFSHGLAALGCRPVTLDFSPRMLQAGMRLYDLPAAVLHAVPPLPFGSGTLDAVIANGMLHHCKAQGVLAAVVSEIHRVLKPSGMFYLYDRNGAWAGRCMHHLVLRVKRTLRRHLSSSSSASSHEPDFLIEDLQTVLSAGFCLRRQRHLSTLPTFAAIVATNTLRYAGWDRLAMAGQRLARPLLQLAEQHLARRGFTVEQCLCLGKVPSQPARRVGIQ